MPTLAEFNTHRRPFQSQYFPCPGATKTVLISSHIWWTEQIALAFLNAGCNVLAHYPFYFLYTDDTAWPQFDKLWNDILHSIREHKVDFIFAGNATAIVPYPKTNELLHRAANIPVVHYWWDEPRSLPPFARRLPNILPDDYLRFLRDEKTLNLIWDIDVLEELAAFHNITNTSHLPLATLPEFWQTPGATFTPLEKRPLDACFLGNCHGNVDWVDSDPDPINAWARQIVSQKIANLDTPMKSCIQAAGPIPKNSHRLAARPDPWAQFFLPWEIINSTYMHRTRNLLVKAAADHLKGKLALIGKGWQSMGLRANSEHAADKSALIYAQSKASLNLFGGCVHGGMPLRPYDIAASGGLILTHYQRELPDLFEPDKECLAFKNQSEMLAHLDRVITTPQGYNPIALAAHRRTLVHHTWQNRIQKILTAVQERF